MKDKRNLRIPLRLRASDKLDDLQWWQGHSLADDLIQACLILLVVAMGWYIGVLLCALSEANAQANDPTRRVPDSVKWVAQDGRQIVRRVGPPN